MCRGADLDDLCPYLRNASMLDLVARFLRDLRTRMFVRVQPSTSVDGTLLVQATTISGVLHLVPSQVRVAQTLSPDSLDSARVWGCDLTQPMYVSLFLVLEGNKV